MKKILQIFIAIIPLIVSFSTSDPTLAIRFLILSILISGILVYYLVKKQEIYKEVIMHPAMIAFGLIIICYVLSAFFNGFGSESIYIILKLFLSYVFAVVMIQFVNKEGYKPLLNSFLYFSLIVSAIYFFQIISNYSEIIKIESEWLRNKEFDQIASTMGHKNLLSSIQFLMLPALIYLLFNSKRLIKILSAIALTLIAVTLFQTQTRAVLFALFLFSISMFLLQKTNIKRKHILTLLIGTILFLSTGYAVIKYTNRYDAFIGEINNTLNFTSSSRYTLYNSSIDLIKDHLLFGVGPGKWRVDIWEYGLYEGTYGNSFAQRPHNDFLWVFSEGGFIAGISYIILFLILLRESYILYKQRNKEDRLFYSLLFSTFLGFGFISLVDFPLERFSHNIIFFVLAAFVISQKLKNIKNKIPKWIKLLLLIVSLFTIHVALIRYQGEIHAANAIDFKNEGKSNYVIKAIEKAYNKKYYEMENTSTPLLWYRGVAYFNQKKYGLALEDFETAYKLNPHHVHVLNNLATLYEIKGDRNRAKEFYTAALKVNPTFKESRINLSAILFNEKKYVEALDVILQSKVDAYWKRKQKNDNYDLYLKTIVKSWVNSVIPNTTEQESKILRDWALEFEKIPEKAAKKAQEIFKIRTQKKVDYLTALLQLEKES